MAKDLEALPRPWVLGQVCGGVAKAMEALPRPWGRVPGHGVVAKAVGLGQGLGGVAKSGKAKPNPNPKAMEGSQGRGGWPRPWGGVAIGVEALPRAWGRGQGRGGVAEAVGPWPRP